MGTSGTVDQPRWRRHEAAGKARLSPLDLEGHAPQGQWDGKVENSSEDGERARVAKGDMLREMEAVRAAPTGGSILTFLSNLQAHP